jgi:hypothetical protein
LLLIAMASFLVPVVVGANCTVIVQLSPFLNVAGQFDVDRKSAPGPVVPTFRTVPPLLLVIVTV